MFVCMWLGKGVIKGTARIFHLPSIRENANSLPLAKNIPHTMETWSCSPLQSTWRASCFGFGFRTGFGGEGSVRGEKLIESDPTLCPQGFSRGAPRKSFRESGRSTNILPFHMPIKPRLNPSASQPAAGVAVLFSLVFYMLVEGGRLRSLALTK